jgi:hypothetical protein
VRVSGTRPRTPITRHQSATLAFLLSHAASEPYTSSGGITLPPIFVLVTELGPIFVAIGSPDPLLLNNIDDEVA